jgi:bifunctional non-homologous end joining protein LigD
LNGNDLRREVRKATLTSVLAKGAVGIRFNEHMEFDDGEAVFYHARKLGLEGIVSKRKDSDLPSRRSSARSRAAPMLLSHGLTIDHKKLPGK